VALAFCVWFALRYAVSIPVLMIEDLGVLDTIRRSVFLTRGRRGHIFLGLLVAAIIAYVGIFLFQIPFVIATMVAAMRGHWPFWLASASATASAIGIAITGPISMIVTVLLYYDTRIRKEAFDLQFMISSLDRPAPATGTVSPA
jgi:Membrane domain of glycerophosphoryl diester phosphodiesterase